jgi:zinc D-Ala-D-Ala carboxypeptidase
MNWEKYPNFSEEEFACSETGECKMSASFMKKMQELRDVYGNPMTITSGYRSPKHSIEASKPTGKLSTHARGCAADIACNGQQAYEIMKLAFQLGFTGIGVSQKGSARFVHLDTFSGSPRPNIWSY